MRLVQPVANVSLRALCSFRTGEVEKMKTQGEVKLERELREMCNTPHDNAYKKRVEHCLMLFDPNESPEVSEEALLNCLRDAEKCMLKKRTMHCHCKLESSKGTCNSNSKIFNGQSVNCICASHSVNVTEGESKLAIDERRALDEILAPMEVEGDRCFGFVDSGCAQSTIDFALAKKLRIPMKKCENSYIVLADKSRIKVEFELIQPIVFRYGLHTFKHKFQVGAITHSVYIGRDLFSKLGIRIEGLPQAFPHMLGSE